MDERRSAMLVRLLQKAGRISNSVGNQFWGLAETKPTIGNRTKW